MYLSRFCVWHASVVYGVNVSVGCLSVAGILVICGICGVCGMACVYP